MDAYKISVKLFAEQDVFEPSEFLPIFHHWIQTHKLPDHLLIDVADYAHVPDGPGTVLITSQANISTDRAAGRFGLLYFRKLPLGDTFGERLRMVVTSALTVATLLEDEPSVSGRLKFRTDEILIRINDRLLAPNTSTTFDQVRPDIEALARQLYPEQKFTLEHKPSPLTLFETHLRTEQSLPAQQLLHRFGVVSRA